MIHVCFLFLILLFRIWTQINRYPDDFSRYSSVSGIIQITFVTQSEQLTAILWRLAVCFVRYHTADIDKVEAICSTRANNKMSDEFNFDL
jgi:hypothetical protein